MRGPVIIHSGVNKYKSKVIAGAEVWAFHQPGSVDLICDVVKEFAPQIIIEFGTGNGGLTLPLHETCPQAELHTFDLWNDPPGSEYIASKQDQFTGGWAYTYPAELVKGPIPRNWFGPTVAFYTADTQEPHDDIKALFIPGHRKLLYCDGGHTPTEVGIYAPLLSPGDLLGVHRWEQEFHESTEHELLAGFRRHRWQQFEANNFMTRFWCHL